VRGHGLAIEGLLASSRFRRFLLGSAIGHVLLLAILVVAPNLPRVRPPPEPLFVDLVAPPEPAKAPPAAQPPARQELKQPLVLKPKKKAAKPKPPPPKKEPVEEVEEEAPPSPPPSAAEILAQLREKVGTDPEAKPQAVPARAGRFDPELAAYRRQVTALLRSNWAGAASWEKEGLAARFEAQVEATGRIRSVSRVRSSGDWVFDDAAERAIWSSEPFPPPPRGALTLDLLFNPKGVF
jgi:TonB family protein